MCIRDRLGRVELATLDGNVRLAIRGWLDQADAAREAIAITVAIQSAPDEGHQVLEVHAALVADPRNPAVAWVQVQLLAATRMPRNSPSGLGRSSGSGGAGASSTSALTRAIVCIIASFGASRPAATT